MPRKSDSQFFDELSLVAVFIPILLMGGIVGRLFREFAVVSEHCHRVRCSSH